MRILRVSLVFFGFVAAFVQTSFAKSEHGSDMPPVVENVELAKYSGLWYEVAHSPNFFQRKCIRSTAEYGVISENQVSVYNTCYKANGKISDIHGVATILNSSEPAKLEVEFKTFFSPKGDYWISLLDEQYEWSVVSGPGNKFVFILSRTAGISDSLKQEILSKMELSGIPTEHLIFDQY